MDLTNQKNSFMLNDAVRRNIPYFVEGGYKTGDINDLSDESILFFIAEYLSCFIGSVSTVSTALLVVDPVSSVLVLTVASLGDAALNGVLVRLRGAHTTGVKDRFAVAPVENAVEAVRNAGGDVVAASTVAGLGNDTGGGEKSEEDELGVEEHGKLEDGIGGR